MLKKLLSTKNREINKKFSTISFVNISSELDQLKIFQQLLTKKKTLDVLNKHLKKWVSVAVNTVILFQI